MPPVVPGSLVSLLSLLRPAFTAPSFDTFCWLVHGFIGRVGEHTITGIWQAARLAGVIHHSRAHEFFARRRWSTDRLGLVLAELVVERLIAGDAAIRIAVDETLFGRSGRRVFAASWHFDSVQPERGKRRLRFGNSFVCLGLLVELHGRTVCLPLLFRLWRPGSGDHVAPSRIDLAHELVALLAGRFSEREFELVADSYYANRKLALLPANVSACVRLRSHSVLTAPAPEPAKRGRGRPRKRGQRLGSVRELAAAPSARWRPLSLPGAKPLEVQVFACIWYRVLGTQRVRVVIARERGKRSEPLLAVLSTEPKASAAEILSRYADRWAIEVAFAEAKGQLGVGEARNRVEAAVQRTVPFGFLCRALVIIWYSLHGDPEADVKARLLTAPWYRHKRAPAFADMLVSLRRELIRAELRQGQHRSPTRQEIERFALAAPATVA